MTKSLKQFIWESFVWVLWLSFLIWYTFLCIKMSQTPLYETHDIDLHQPYTWSGDSIYTLVGKGSHHLYARSEGSNFVILDDKNNFICTGSPAEFQPGEDQQPFQCDFILQDGRTYHLKNYANLYSQTPVEITFEVDRLGYPLLASLLIIFLVPSLYFGSAYFLTNLNKIKSSEQ